MGAELSLLSLIHTCAWDNNTSVGSKTQSWGRLSHKTFAYTIPLRKSPGTMIMSNARGGGIKKLSRSNVNELRVKKARRIV